MPNNYIAINGQVSRLGSNLYAAVCLLADAKMRIEQLKGVMDNMTDGIDYSTLEANFGITTGKGQSVYNLVTGANSEMAADTSLVNLLNWLGATK